MSPAHCRHLLTCTGATKDAKGNVTVAHAELVPDTKSGTPGASAIKVKGIITWGWPWPTR
jgi:glutaminyl-tRNA synthetase